MPGFQLADTPFDIATLRAQLLDDRVGGYASFEGWVRNHNDGRAVHGLRYEAYVALAEKEGASILEQARASFEIIDALCVHRVGDLAIGELAVWVGVSARTPRPGVRRVSLHHRRSEIAGADLETRTLRRRRRRLVAPATLGIDCASSTHSPTAACSVVQQFYSNRSRFVVRLVKRQTREK